MKTPIETDGRIAMQPLHLPYLPLLFMLLPAAVVADSDCWDSAATQTEMNACADQDYIAADKMLNEVYQEILREYADDPAFLDRLRDAQRAWLLFRDAQVAALFPHQDEAQAYYGSLFPMCKASWLTELTQQRTEQLRLWLEGSEEGDACAGSIRVHENAAASRHEITVSDNGVGPITADTPFDPDVLQQALPAYSVRKSIASSEGEEFIRYNISDEAGLLFTINPDQAGGIFSVVIESETIPDASGTRIGARFADVYPAALHADCYPGMEEFSGTMSCIAPGAEQVLYVFTGHWDGPDGQRPPNDVLGTWTVDKIVWRSQYPHTGL
jgi:uncharacterized protein YecT (DUF1311 family)